MKTRSIVAEWPHAVNMCILIFMILLVHSLNAEVSIYVSVSRGNDTVNTGLSPSSPFQTLQKAANTVTSLKNVATKNDTYIVYIEEGRYWITSTITIPRPNRYNDASSRVIWKPWNENHQVVITGGVPLPVKLWSLVTEYNNPQVFDMLPPSARGKVLQLNLTQAGLFKSQLIPLNRTGFYSGIQASNELFYKGKAFYWARYPNKLPDETESFLKISFTNGGNRVDFDASKSENRNKWPLEKRPFAFGFWYYDWAEGIEDLQNITSNGTFHFVQSTITYGVQKNQRFFLLNFLSELDQKGEYIIQDEMIYAIPHGPLTHDDDMILSVTDQIFTAQAQAQEFHSMRLEMCRGFAISGYGSYYVVKNMIISNTGNAGVQISQCHFGCQIVNSTFYELGQGGLNIGGGVRAYLNATNTLIMNNTMFNFTRIGKCYRPGVNIVGGVGYTITHNEIYSADHSAIVYKGNNHDISYNKIYDVCKIVGDAGAIYSGRDWTFRGNTIRYNLIAKSRGPGLYGTTCLYLDDRYSSAEVYGNIFYDCSSP